MLLVDDEVLEVLDEDSDDFEDDADDSVEDEALLVDSELDAFSEAVEPDLESVR